MPATAPLAVKGMCDNNSRKICLSIRILPDHGFFAAVRAQSVKLQKVSANRKIGLPGEPCLELVEVTIGEIDDGAAVGANQVVMVYRRPPHQVAATAAAHVHFTDKTELRKYFEGTIDGNQSDARMAPRYSFMYPGRGQVLVAGSNGVQYGEPLRSYFITPPP